MMALANQTKRKFEECDGSPRKRHKTDLSSLITAKSLNGLIVARKANDSVSKNSSRYGAIKWKTLQHKGPVFAPPYKRLPSGINFFYGGKAMKLSVKAEEVATFYAKMLTDKCTSKPVFKKNFFAHWRQIMNDHERSIITQLSKCNFTKISNFFKQQAEARKNMSADEKKKIKKKNEKIQEEHGYCLVDGRREKVANFKVEPPGLFRGRGNHPKMGYVKLRVMPEDVIINCGERYKQPVPPPGHQWKEVRHDRSVSWLACWTENVQRQPKYIMLGQSSQIRTNGDKHKYDISRMLKSKIGRIRRAYTSDLNHCDEGVRQRGVALYLIDKLALRAGNEKGKDRADTVGCCSLRVNHITLHKNRKGKRNIVILDFPGKDSIRYYNEVQVDADVFRNLQKFTKNKGRKENLFNKLSTTSLNKYLNEQMEGLTAKVFRTFNASITLQKRLRLLTKSNFSTLEKVQAYNQANREVAVLCNHQRAVPQTYAKGLSKLQIKQRQKVICLKGVEKKLNKLQPANVLERLQLKFQTINDQLTKIEHQIIEKKETKCIALGTSKLNYLDPRISIAWSKKYNVPINKIYTKLQQEKFQWAIDTTGKNYVY